MGRALLIDLARPAKEVRVSRIKSINFDRFYVCVKSNKDIRIIVVSELLVSFLEYGSKSSLFHYFLQKLIVLDLFPGQI